MPKQGKTGCQLNVRAVKSTDYKPAIWWPTLILGEDLTISQFLRGDRGGDTCLCVVFIIMTSKKPRGPLAKWARTKKNSLCGIRQSLFWVKKKRNFAPKENTEPNQCWSREWAEFGWFWLVTCPRPLHTTSQSLIS